MSQSNPLLDSSSLPRFGEITPDFVRPAVDAVADAFGRFEEAGIFNADTGRAFLVNILEPGGTHDAMELFVALCGRKPDVAALLRQSGLAA